MSKLLAPNGKPSKLTPEQYKLVRTPAFKKWFGDWENDPNDNMLIENGEPMIWWHTGGDWIKLNNDGINGKGKLMFSPTKKSMAYGRDGEQMITRPFFIKSDFIYMLPYEDRDITSAYRWNKNKKNPIWFVNAYGGFVVVRQSNQIKLADGTNTTFDGGNPDIRFDEGGEVYNGYKLPKYLYHLTSEKIFENIKKESGLNPEYSKQSKGEKGIYLTDDKSVAENYAGFFDAGEKLVLLKISTDDMDISKFTSDDYELQDFLDDGGWGNDDERIEEYSSWDEVPFELSLEWVNQVQYHKFIPIENIEIIKKLADGTNTTFDENNDDIRFKKGGELKAEDMLKKPLTIKYIKDLDNGEGWWVDTFHAKTKNYLPNTYYHLNTSGNNAGVGKGLYLGRDKNALISFYGIQDGIENDFDTHLLDTYLGNPNWLDLMNYDKYEKIKKESLDKYRLPINLKGLEELDAIGELMKKLVMEKGYDGIRYYDPNATGEEFVLFNTEKVKKITNEKLFKKGGEVNTGLFSQIWEWFGIKF